MEGLSELPKRFIKRSVSMFRALKTAEAACLLFMGALQKNTRPNKEVHPVNDIYKDFKST